MTNNFDLDEIRACWTRRAKEHGQSHEASWSDLPVIQMEIREIVRRLEDGDRVLDVGCGNGFSTLELARRKQIRIRGLDYVPEMVEQARSRLAQLPPSLAERIEFDVGDITSLKEPESWYDIIVVVRVLINLHGRERQIQGLREVARVVRPGGRVLLSEATLQGWSRLNDFRREWGLADIPVPAFNQYLDVDEVLAAAPPELRLVECVDFSSSYYVGTRVIKPLLARILSKDVDVARSNMEWNRWCAQLPPAGDYGVQRLFVLEKK